MLPRCALPWVRQQVVAHRLQSMLRTRSCGAEAGLRLAEAGLRRPGAARGAALGGAPGVAGGASDVACRPCICTSVAKTITQVPASPASVVGLQLIEGMLEGEPHKFTPHSMVKHPAWQCPNSAPTPPQGGPGSSGWLSWGAGALGARALLQVCSSQPPPGVQRRLSDCHWTSRSHAVDFEEWHPPPPPSSKPFLLPPSVLGAS